jgi:hypothetical protein
MMSKNTLFDIVNKLRPLIVKKDIEYHFAIHVKVQVIYVIYKLSYGSNLLTYNELFTISKSIIVLVTCEIMKVSTLSPKLMEVVMLKFINYCVLPNVHRTINDTNIFILKPNIGHLWKINFITWHEVI